MNHPNASLFIADCTDLRVPTEELRNRYRKGAYGKLKSEHVKGWIKMAGRAVNGQGT